MAISEDLQRRIQNLIGPTKGAISNREMELFQQALPEASPNFITLTNGSDTRIFRSNDPVIIELINQGYYEVKPPSMVGPDMFSAGERRLLEQRLDEEQQDLLNQLSADFNQNIVQPTKGAISNREMELFQQALPVTGGSIEDLQGYPIPTIDPRIQEEWGQEQQQKQQLLELEKRFGAQTPSPTFEINEDISKTLDELLQQIQSSNDPEEIDVLENMIENTIVKAKAPYASLMDELSMTAGEDDMMAHVRRGDLNISREMVEGNPQFEDAIEKAAREKGVDPESLVYGTGIATLHESTGLEQHGFLKKLVKGIGKVVKKVAPIAMFIPGVGTALGGVLGGLGGGITGAISKVAPRLGGFLGSTGSTIAKGIAGLNIPGVSAIAGGATDPSGAFGALKAGGFKGAFAGGPLGGIMGQGPELTPVTNANGVVTGYTDPSGQAYTVAEAQAIKNPNFFGSGKGSLYGGLGTGIGSAPTQMVGPNGQPMYNAQGQPIMQQGRGGLLGGLLGGGGGLLGGGGSGGGGIGSLLGLAGAGALAGQLGKLAYEETKKDKGVALTPLTTMDASGRYNIEAEIARRMGQPAPNPVEFGLLPEGTFPTLSGGQPRPATGRYGGPVMAYAEGGEVSMEDFDRKNGAINGFGTETSDDVPAMLSDGEFVMTGQAVRGAGSFELENDGGILTLIPSLDEDRERGIDLMYTMMEVFGSRANTHH